MKWIVIYLFYFITSFRHINGLNKGDLCIGRVDISTVKASILEVVSDGVGHGIRFGVFLGRDLVQFVDSWKREERWEGREMKRIR